jgi:hypothetical protein
MWPRDVHRSIAVFLILISGVQTGEVQRLREYLLRGYDRSVHPGAEVNEVTKVEVDLKIVHIQYLDEWSEKLELKAYLRATWRDSRLVWRRGNDNRVSKIIFNPSSVWTPDICLLNSAVMSNAFLLGSSNVVVTSEGQVAVTSSVTLSPLCQVDIAKYPYDVQNCSIRLGSCTKYDGRMELVLPEAYEVSEVSSDFIDNNQWHLVEQDVKTVVTNNPYCKENITELEFGVHLKRRNPYYGVTLVTPCVMALTLIMLVFWLPPDCGERIIIGCATALLMLLQLLYLSYRLPPMRSGVPSIAFVTSKLMLQVTVGALLSAVGITSISVPIRNPPYRLMRWFIRTRVSDLVCVTRPARCKVNGSVHISNGKSEADEEQIKMAQYRKEWIACLVICDRLNFLGLFLSYGGLILFLVL